MTTEMEVERLRMKPNVEVAVAMSCGATKFWRAMRGDWKFGPTPMPMMIWKTIIFAQFFVPGSMMNRPTPKVMKNIPNQIGGRYLPVFFMKTPVPPETIERERQSARIYTPDSRGVAPKTAWKYSGR